MSDWRKNYDKAFPHIAAGFSCFAEVKQRKQIEWLLNTDGAINISEHIGYHDCHFLMKPSIATLFRCKFGEVKVQKVTAYQLANLMTTEYVVKTTTSPKNGMISTER